MSTRLGRRGFVGGAAALSAGFASGLWSAAAARAASAMGFDEARHLLARTSFGATPAEIRALEARDYTAAVDGLLANPRREAITPAPGWIAMGPEELQRLQKAAQAQRKQGLDGKNLEVMLPVREQGRELKNWWVEEMLTTDQPLVERMTLFWHGHFTSSLMMVRYPSSLFRQNALFRREALGNYATLLRAVARDPAMLIYLDGRGSVARQPNENFARELLELFTLGEGQYGEADIKAAARAFTGWSVDRESGQFVEHSGRHDDGQKTFLGKSGRFGGDEILTILLAHPRTAETIVEKLWREFVSLTARSRRSDAPGGRIPPRWLRDQTADAGALPVRGLPRARQPGRPHQVAGRPYRRLGPRARPPGAGKDRTGPHAAGPGAGAFRPAEREGMGRWRELDLDLHAAAAPAVHAPHDRGDQRGADGGRHADGQPSRPACRSPRAASRARDAMQMMEPPRPVEGRSLRNAGNEVRLGPTLWRVSTAPCCCRRCCRARRSMASMPAGLRARSWRGRCSIRPIS
jgi:hypothetical protein